MFVPFFVISWFPWDVAGALDMRLAAVAGSAGNVWHGWLIELGLLLFYRFD